MAESGVSTEGLAAKIESATNALAGLGERITPGGDLGSLTTYRVGGAAALLATVQSVEDLELISGALTTSGLPVLVVGRGSNLLVSDSGFPGIAVLLDPAAFSTVEVSGTRVTAGAALPFPALARQSVEAGLSGLEWAVGVPGSVGGAVRMNAGGHGSEVAHHLETAEIFDLADGAGLRQLPLERLEFGYRHSSIAPQQVVIAATFALSEGNPDEGRETIREIVRWRREHQPGGQNAGSVFTNPAGTSAGWLIETAGLKGRRHRSAQVSPKHANFIQADPGGSADDVHELIEMVRQEVLQFHGIELQTEVRMIAFPQVEVEG